jgi:hypothetical protein
MTTTFEVDRVQPAFEAAPEAPLPEVFQPQVGLPFLACTDVDASLLTKTAHHPFAAAVYCAFAQHRPLILTPDAVWLTIAQGFAQHVNSHSKRLRRSLVRHRGMKKLTVTAYALDTPQDWALAIDGLCEKVRSNTKSGVADLMRCDFSTTTAVTRVAGDVVLLDALQRYFIYEMEFICGIPQVTLLGTADDWRKIEQRVAALATYDLSWWTDRLLPVCRELRRTVEGKPDLDFWQCICMPQEVYGGEIVTGWIGRFFPYLETVKRDKAVIARGSYSDPTLSQLVRNDGLAPWSENVGRDLFEGRRSIKPEPARRRWLCDGVKLDDLPLGLSRAPARITNYRGRLIVRVQLVSGFVGVTQTDSLAVQPHIGWAVVESARPVACLAYR